MTMRSGVAQAVAAVGAAAYEAVVFLVELVIVVVEVAHGNETFALVLVDFDIEAVVGNT